MRVLVITEAVLLSCTLSPSRADETAPARQAQATVPVQPDRTPEQAEQARDQDRKNAEDVKIERDWKAQGGTDGDRAGRANQSDQDHQTVGRDWRARPDNAERR
ncbi:hypothetical protein ACVWZK_007033 [Bradyrhizobium sp. GM0.4]